MLRKFDSGVMVIQNKAHSDEEVQFHFLVVFFADPVIVWQCKPKSYAYVQYD